MSRLLLLAALAGLLVACTGSDDGGTPPSIPGAAIAVDDPFSGGYPTYDHEESGLRVVFGTPDLGPGTSRVSFAIFDDVGIVSFPAIEVATRFYPDGPEDGATPGEQATLAFQPFPEGGRGIYTGALTFAEPGLWSIEASVARPDGSVAHILFPVEVAEDASAPGIGDLAPASSTRTAADVDSFEELTTASEPDPRLYATSIAAAREAGRPFVVTFASPAFCTNALCGPEVEVLSALADEHEGDAEFIHVELYENPDEIRGDLSVARRVPALEEWGLHTDQWTFVVDAEGHVTARFEGFAPLGEIEAALQQVLTN